MSTLWRRRILTETAEKHIELAVADLESVTGAELKVAIVQSSDPYPAASWRFTMTSFLVIFPFIFEYIYSKVHHEWEIGAVALAWFFLLYTLGRVPVFRNLFLHPVEVRREVREKAFQLFHELQVHETSHRAGSFLMISISERRMEFLVDKFLRSKITDAELDQIVAELQAAFKQKDYEAGLMKCIALLKIKFQNDLPEVRKHLPDIVGDNQICNRIAWVDRC